MSIQRIPAAQALQEMGHFDSIIDARSPAEFAIDHLPGAINWPTLNDAQRAEVGTLFAQQGAQAARRIGAIYAARNIADHLERALSTIARDWRPLLYCWRGGQRSGALAIILDQIGFRIGVLDGGYKAFRAAMLQDFPARIAALQLRVICGTTGSGKTRLLAALARRGAQVLDLEALALHRSSVLGGVPHQPQPSQKRFDTLLWQALYALDATRPVYVESESRKIGDLSVPLALSDAMRNAPCLVLHLPLEQRVALLLQDYPHWVAQPEAFCERLQALVALRGHDTVAQWQALVRAGRFNEVVEALLRDHYDPGYLRSMERNFVHYRAANFIAAQAISSADMDTLADHILAGAA